MATTITPAPARYDHDGNQRRVRHPLQLLRKTIRTYVLLEGTAVVLLFAAALFWAGVALDYGVFRLFALDWIQELRELSSASNAFGVRLFLLIVLAGILVMLIVTRIAQRWLKEFSDANLALVLERRFPRELGDRLITAVEIADPALARRYGFSQPMVERTVEEAIDRLEKLPVNEVFNWARLRRLWLIVAGVTVGLFVLTGIGVCGAKAVMGRDASPVDFAWRFQQVASTWAERNVLLLDTYWPRRAYLELLRFKPATSDPAEMRIGPKHGGLQVRAVRWVVADRAAPDGWRPLRWSDLPDFVDPATLQAVNLPADWPHWVVDLDDLDPRVPADLVPSDWQGKTSGAIRVSLAEPAIKTKLDRPYAREAIEALLDWHEWNIDKLEIEREKSEVSLALRDAGVSNALTTLFVELNELADSARVSRRLRRLELPKDVELTYRGNKTKSQAPGKPSKDRKFDLDLSDLKESVRFRVRAEDYYTPLKRLALTAPPSLTALDVDKEEPAYLYWRLQGDDQSPLRGRRETILNYPVSTTGELTTIEIPLGAHLVINARVDRPLQTPILTKEGGDDPTKPKQSPLRESRFRAMAHEDRQGFSANMGDVTNDIDLVFEFMDEDNIAGQRRVLVRPVLDQPPEIVEVDLDYVPRKPRFTGGKAAQGSGAEGFLVTPDALIPFKGTASDDHGLARVGWLHEVRQVEIELVGRGSGKDRLPVLILQGSATPRRAGLLVSGLQFSPAAFAAPQVVPAYLAWMQQFIAVDLAQSASQGEVFVLMERFKALQEAKSVNDPTLGAFERQQPQDKTPARLVPWPHQLKDEDGFDLRKFLPKLKARDSSSDVQMHYLVRLNIQAVDNNVETGALQQEGGKTFHGNATRSKSFHFLVVSENELLSQIAIEEETLYERLERALEKLKAGITTTEDQVRKLNSGDRPDVDNLAIRMGEVRKAVLDAGSMVREVDADYTRILRELEVNRVTRGHVDKIREKICQPLDEIVNPAPPEPEKGERPRGSFARTEDAVQKACGQLEEDAAANRPADRERHLAALRAGQEQMELARDHINDILNSMREGIDEARLLEQLIRAEQVQRDIHQHLRVLYNEELRRLLEGVINQPQKK